MPTNVALTGLARDLAARAADNKPIQVGIVGSGEMGTDLITQISRMPGLNVAAVTDRHPQKIRAAVRLAFGDEDRISVINPHQSLGDSVRAGRLGLVTNLDHMLAFEGLDVVIDATGRPSASVEVGLKAINAGKHLVMMNVEADVTVGPLLHAEAKRQGVTYSLGAGDEPSSCIELIEFAAASGLNVVAAGKGKNNPLNPEAVPDDLRQEALARNMNPRLLVEFVDGSKTMVEMTALANATGLIPDIAGMHGPCTRLADLPHVLVPKADGGILSSPGRVDYSIGPDIAPGVFIIVHADHPRIAERMRDLNVTGSGAYFVLSRPFHLTSLEVPLTCARAVLYQKPDMVPLNRPVAEACAVAKKDLKPGERLDAIGEYTYRGYILSAQEARQKRAIPVGLLHGGKALTPISKGELITYEKAAPPENSPLVAFRARQDAMIDTE